MKAFNLPSGAVLHVSEAPFEDAKNLYQIVLKELKTVDITVEADMVKVSKEVMCSLLSSKRIEKAVWKCMERSTYNKRKMTPDIFEDSKARGDYIECLYRVARENLEPFTKSLYAKFQEVMAGITSSQA